MALPEAPRHAAAEDLPAVAELEREVFSDPWSSSAFAEYLYRPGAVFLALDGESSRLEGFAIGMAIHDEGEILNLAVHPARRRRGSGRLLLEALVAELRQLGAASLFLEVRSSNQAAIGLYERCGFRRIGRRRGYYAKPREDSVTMVLDGGLFRQEKDEEPHEIG